MNKLLFLSLMSLFLVGCSEQENIKNEFDEHTLINDISEKTWLHEGYELTFKNDGTLSFYSSGAGNPYHNFDLCEDYSFNIEMKEFLFNNKECSMKFIDFNQKNNSLTLSIDGETMVFKKQ